MLLNDTLLLPKYAILLRKQEFLFDGFLLEIVELLNHVHLLLLEHAHDLLRVFLEELDLGLASALFQSYDFYLVLLLQHLYCITDISLFLSDRILSSHSHIFFLLRNFRSIFPRL